MQAKISYLILIFLLGHELLAQEKFREVYLLDKQSKQAIPYAILYLDNISTSYLSDEQGKILLSTKHKEDELVNISHVSIENISLAMGQIGDTLFVQTKEYILAESFVENQSALSLIKKSIEAINKNYGSEQKYFAGLYRQIHKENGKHVRLIEAQIEVSQESTASNLRLIQEEKFHISAMRKSYVYEKNGEQHGDHLVDLFTYNPIQYLERGIFNPNALQAYTWEIIFSDASVYKIKFQNKPWYADHNINGSLILNKEDLALLKLEILETENLSAFPKSKSNWTLINSRYLLEYIKIGDVYLVNTSTLSYAHQVKIGNDFDGVKYLVEEEFTFSTDHQKEANKDLIYALQSNLYRSELKYNPSQWEAINIEDAIYVDLGFYLELEKQFSQE